ncbi:MAG: nitroreductase family protein [Acidimicrobiales bacterium]
MVRAFRPEPIPDDSLARVLDAGRRAPAAGNTREGRRFVTLTGGETNHYWDVTLGDRREAFRWPRLLLAPVLVVVCCSPDAYASRYAEPDKASRLGAGPTAWPQPFWWIDAGMAVEAMLLAARAEGLGACFFGLFGHEVAVLRALGIPDGWRGAGTVAMGYADPERDEPGRSAGRHLPTSGP